MKLTPFQWSSFNFFGFYAAFGVLVPFLPVWLNHHQYNVDTIGTLIALGYLFRLVGAMFFSKKIKEPNQLLPLSRFLTWGAVVLVIGMAWSVSSIWFFVPLLAFFHIVNGGAMPIADTIAANWQQQNMLDYGKSRLFGSLAFVVSSVSTGFLLEWMGQDAIISILALWLILLGIGISFQPSQTFKSVRENQTHQEISYRQLLSNRTTVRMIIAVSLVQASHAAYYAYSTMHWTSNGISTQQASLLWGLSVLAEVLFFYFSKRLFGNMGIRTLVLVAIAGAMIRWGLLASTVEFSCLVLVQLLHTATFGISHYAMIRYIATQPMAHSAKLQALYFSVANCGAMAALTFIAGKLYLVSPQVSFGLMAATVIPALFILPKKFIVKMQTTSGEKP